MSRSPGLAGKTALVTGGASGIGLATATRLSGEGTHVIIADINIDLAREAADRLGGTAIGLDVASEASWLDLVETVRTRFGGIDFLANCAGIAKMRNLRDVRLEEYRQVIDVNQVGTFLGLKAAIALMGDRKGSIVNLSSINSLRGSADSTAYAASKAAVISMTMTAARDLVQQIRVNVVLPGIIATTMQTRNSAQQRAGIDRLLQIPGRMGEAEEVAEVILFLLSDLSSYITGAQIVVDGGLTLGSPK
ncbi:SDR family NAD(P)-dependent oxidoreductase [Paraburkholderia sp. J12]|uniref:SDR family NAD(P)-dependent oxidoreductase n=1 Tax=Paraburkholderia sp. J12 TaxID=2805432 RepID=UPI002ABDF584|nr:SDR family NAD(P)-dependent oxidoreductase [Paraburkholderia sp. J12]